MATMVNSQLAQIVVLEVDERRGETPKKELRPAESILVNKPGAGAGGDDGAGDVFPKKGRQLVQDDTLECRFSMIARQGATEDSRK